MIPGEPRLALRRWRKAMIALALSATLALSVVGIQSASASTRSRLALSLNPDRSNAVRLDGSTVKGKIYVFVRNSETLDKVDFYLDSSSRTKPPVRTDTDPPFDFAGTADDGTAVPYDTTKLADGSHSIRVVLTWSNGTTSRRRGNFTVANKGAAPTTNPAPTTTTASPTATNTASQAAPTTTAPATTTAAPTTTTATPTTTPPAAPTPTTQTPTSKPSQSSTAPTPGATTPASPAASCLSGGGVAIGAGDDAQSVVNAHAAGTTYIVKAGTHLRNFSVQPKSGDRFCGEPGAVLDGGRSLASAFFGGATNVTLDSIRVQEYNPGWQGAAIQPQSRASGWVVRNVSALHNGWAGLLVADGMKILGGHYNDNDQLGIGGNAATGIVVDGLDDNPGTLDGPELARNHTLHAACEWEAGGMKWDVGQVTVRNAYVHDNDCRGLWADINARGALIEHNLIENNFREGIFYEISQDAVIRYNSVYGNGHAANGWYWDAGILVNASFNVEVYGNRLSGNYNGITGVQQDRPDSTPPEHLLNNFHSYDNLICATGGGGHPTGVVADNGANLAARDISFTRNTIQSSPCE
jgi:Right handed beta helix region